MKICKRCGRKLKGKVWTISNRKKIAQARLMGRLDEDVCPDCQRHGEAFVATLQVRGRFDRALVESIINDELNKSIERGENENVYLKSEDYRFTSKSLASKVAKRLVGIGAEIKKSSKLISFDRQKSIPLHRLTLAVKFRVLKGDIIKLAGTYQLVEKVSSSWVWTNKGKKIKLKDAEPVDAEELDAIVISERPPMVFIEKTGETLEIENLKGNKLREKIKLKRKEDTIITM
ncbi:MAG: hypothetical protein GOU99_01440 [Candidatus Altiarchaeota archaeon]|nr:hypothetical protein [Candidatus Altiarchaeota archaeon]